MKPPLRGSVFVCLSPPAKTELSSHTGSSGLRRPMTRLTPRLLALIFVWFMLWLPGDASAQAQNPGAPSSGITLHGTNQQGSTINLQTGNQGAADSPLAA